MRTASPICTPLTSIIGSAETIGEESESLRAQDPDVEIGPIGRFAGLIENSGRRLLGTLDAVLNLSKLEGEEADLDAATINLAAKAEEVAEQFLPQAEDATIDLQVDIEKAPLHAQGDQEGLRIAPRTSFRTPSSTPSLEATHGCGCATRTARRPLRSRTPVWE